MMMKYQEVNVWGPGYQSGAGKLYSYLQSPRCISKYLLTLVRLGDCEASSWLECVGHGGGGPTPRHCLVLPSCHALHFGLPSRYHQSLLLLFRPRPAGYQEIKAVRWSDLTLLIFSITALYYTEILYMYVHIHIWYEYTWLVFPSITDQNMQDCPVPPHILLQIWLRLRPGSTAKLLRPFIIQDQTSEFVGQYSNFVLQIATAYKD